MYTAKMTAEKRGSTTRHTQLAGWTVTGAGLTKHRQATGPAWPRNDQQIVNWDWLSPCYLFIYDEAMKSELVNPRQTGKMITMS